MMRILPWHSGDGELVAYLDGEAPPAERLRTQRHLRACEQCAARLAHLQAHLRQVDELIGVPPATSAELTPMRPRWATPPALTRAAGIALLVATAALALPAQGRLWRWIGGVRSTAPATVARPPAPAPATAAVRFVPHGGVLVLHFDAHPGEGRIRLRAFSGATASVEVVGGSGAESFVLEPSRLRIQNAPSSRAEYRVRVPAGVHMVHIEARGKVVAELLASALTDTSEYRLPR